MFQAHRPILRRVHTAVHVEIRQYINKIETVTSLGFYSICLKDARYKKLKIMNSVADAVLAVVRLHWCVYRPTHSGVLTVANS
jgi:hypothetical protein